MKQMIQKITLALLAFTGVSYSSCPPGYTSSTTTDTGITFTVCYPDVIYVDNAGGGTFTITATITNNNSISLQPALACFIPSVAGISVIDAGSCTTIGSNPPSLCSGTSSPPSDFCTDGRGEITYTNSNYLTAGSSVSITVTLQASATAVGIHQYRPAYEIGANPVINLPEITLNVQSTCPTITAENATGSTGCIGSTTQGSLAPFVTGGNPPYTYTVSGAVGGNVSVSSTGIYSFNGTAGPIGSFNYQVYDLYDCPSNTATISFPLASGPSIANGVLYTTTFGTPVTGTLNFTGGTPPYTAQTVEIVNGTVVYNNNQFTFTQTNPGASFFRYSLTDANGCGFAESNKVFIYSCEPGNNVAASLDQGFNLIYSLCSPPTVTLDTQFNIAVSISNPDPNNSYPIEPFIDVVPDNTQSRASGLDYVGNGGYPPEMNFNPTQSTALGEGGMGEFSSLGSPLPASTTYSVTLDIFAANTGAFNYVAGIIGNPNLSLSPLDINVVSCSPYTGNNTGIFSCDNVVSGSLTGLVDGGVAPYTFVQTGPISCGNVSIASDGTFTYTAPVGFTGPCTFNYVATDSDGCESSVGSVTVTINESPVANDASFSTCENTELIGQILSATGGNPPYTFAIVTPAGFGTVVITNQTAGTFNYTPDPDSFGIDEFTFQVTDANGCVSNTATVTLSVKQNPITVTGFNTGCVNTPIDGDLSDFVAAGAPPYSFTQAGVPVGGSVAIALAGPYTFSPSFGFSGTGEFGYLVFDSSGCSASGVVEIAISSPTAGATAVSACPQTLVSGNLAPLVTGGFPPYNFGLTGLLIGGNASVTSTGLYNFISNPGFSGPGGFSYQVVDSAGCVANNTVTVDVDNLAATNATIVSCVPSFTSSLTHLVNGGSGALTFTGPLSVSCGEVSIASDGSFTYTAPTGFTGPCTFTYEVVDGLGCLSTGRVTVNVDAPVAGSLAVNDCVNTTINGNLAALFNGVPPSTFSLTGSVLNGTASVSPTGAYSFSPTPGFSGLGGFVYEAVDANGCSATGDISVTISSPVISPTAVNTCLDTPVSGNLAPLVASGFPPYVFSLTGLPVGGAASVSPTGLYNYVPAAGFSGAGGFEYQVTDTVGCVASSDVAIEVDSLAAVSGTLQTCNNSLTGSLVDFVNGGIGSLIFTGPLSSSCGSVTISPTGQFVYNAPTGFTGPCNFVFGVSDSIGCSASGQITIVANTATQVANGTATSCLNGSVSGTLATLVVGTPVEPITFAIVTQPTDGTITSFNPATGVFTYQPNSGFIGTDSFQFQITDGSGCLSNIGTLTIDVVACCPLSNDPFMRLILEQYWGFTAPTGITGATGTV